MDPLLGYFSSYRLQANFLRRSGKEHPVAQLAAMMAASASHGAPLRHVEVDGALADVEADASWWRNRLAMGDPFEREFGGVVLATGEHELPLNLLYNRERLGASFQHDRLRADIPKPEPGAFQFMGDAHLVDWTVAVTQAFDAQLAWAQSTDLFELVRSLQLGDLRDESLDPSWYPRIDATTRSQLRTLPANTYDACSLPEAIWWINVWSRETVEQLDPSRVAGLPWHRTQQLDSGAWLLVATADPPDGEHLDAIMTIARMTEQLDLVGAQQRFGAT